jgi:hypothetical protein
MVINKCEVGTTASDSSQIPVAKRLTVVFNLSFANSIKSLDYTPDHRTNQRVKKEKIFDSREDFKKWPREGLHEGVYRRQA